MVFNLVSILVVYFYLFDDVTWMLIDNFLKVGVLLYVILLTFFIIIGDIIYWISHEKNYQVYCYCSFYDTASIYCRFYFDYLFFLLIFITEAFSLSYLFFRSTGTSLTEVILSISTNPFIFFGFSGNINNYYFSYLIYAGS